MIKTIGAQRAGAAADIAALGSFRALTKERKGNKNRRRWLDFYGLMLMLSVFRRRQTMTVRVNREQVNDTAKLMIHRLIARAIGRDPSLIDRARISLDRYACERYEGYSFVNQWDDLLRLPPSEVRRRLTSRDEEMTRLRLSSPFVVADGIDVSNVELRRRIWQSAKRLAVKSAVLKSAGARVVA